MLRIVPTKICQIFDHIIQYIVLNRRRVYIGGPKQIPNFDLELELIFIVIKEFGKKTDKIIKKSFIRKIRLTIILKIRINNFHNLIAILEVIA
jgi:hypothetical protein